MVAEFCRFYPGHTVADVMAMPAVTFFALYREIEAVRAAEDLALLRVMHGQPEAVREQLLKTLGMEHMMESDLVPGAVPGVKALEGADEIRKRLAEKRAEWERKRRERRARAKTS